MPQRGVRLFSIVTVLGFLMVIILSLGGREQHVSEEGAQVSKPSAPPAGGGQTGGSRGTDSLEFFDYHKDPSFPLRCKETSLPAMPQCDAVKISRRGIPAPALIVPVIPSGSTTRLMELHTAVELTGNNKVVHHPIFHIYAEQTAVAPFEPSRVLEFNGVHTEYNFDCDANVDFRLYHQCRAALCLEHEKLLNRTSRMKTTHESSSAQGVSSSSSSSSSTPSPNSGREAADTNKVHEMIGMFPLVDEEYMEYIMTLTTAYEAAKENRPYTFIELGARYGTWIVRAGVSYKTFAPPASSTAVVNLLAVEGNCHWFQRMVEHVECNDLTAEARLILAYAAPKSYNKVQVGATATYNEPRAVSLLEMLANYEFVDMIDFDIQGFEWLAIEEQGVIELMSQKVGFLHFGTHATDIEKRIVTALQGSGWCVVYFFAGAHTKKLNNGHRCSTPYGPSLFNDGVLGLVNQKFYPTVVGSSCQRLNLGKGTRTTAKTCYSSPLMTSLLTKKPLR
jgi:hypothetical protein